MPDIDNLEDPLSKANNNQQQQPAAVPMLNNAHVNEMTSPQSAMPNNNMLQNFYHQQNDSAMQGIPYGNNPRSAYENFSHPGMMNQQQEMNMQQQYSNNNTSNQMYTNNDSNMYNSTGASQHQQMDQMHSFKQPQQHHNNQ